MRRRYKQAIGLAMEGSGEPSPDAVKTMIDRLLVPALVEEYFRFPPGGSALIDLNPKCHKSQANNRPDAAVHSRIQS